MIKHIMRIYLKSRLEEVSKNKTVMAILFYLEISSFMAAGYSLARLNLISSVLYFLLGLLLAFTVGECIELRGMRKQRMKTSNPEMDADKIIGDVLGW